MILPALDSIGFHRASLNPGNTRSRWLWIWFLSALRERIFRVRWSARAPWIATASGARIEMRPLPLIDLAPSVQGSGVHEIQQISNRRAPKWDQEGLNETTQKVVLNCKDTCLRW
jgi:hypothetical protein